MRWSSAVAVCYCLQLGLKFAPCSYLNQGGWEMLVVDKTTKNLPKIPRLLHNNSLSSGRATSPVWLG